MLDARRPANASIARALASMRDAPVGVEVADDDGVDALLHRRDRRHDTARPAHRCASRIVGGIGGRGELEPAVILGPRGAQDQPRRVADHEGDGVQRGDLRHEAEEARVERPGSGSGAAES